MHTGPQLGPSLTASPLTHLRPAVRHGPPTIGQGSARTNCVTGAHNVAGAAGEHPRANAGSCATSAEASIRKRAFAPAWRIIGREVPKSCADMSDRAQARAILGARRQDLRLPLGITRPPPSGWRSPKPSSTLISFVNRFVAIEPSLKTSTKAVCGSLSPAGP